MEKMLKLLQLLQKLSCEPESAQVLLLKVYTPSRVAPVLKQGDRLENC
jgi:hypothetical protein